MSSWPFWIQPLWTFLTGCPPALHLLCVCLHQPGPWLLLLKSTALPPSGLYPHCSHCLLLQLN